MSITISSTSSQVQSITSSPSTVTMGREYSLSMPLPDLPSPRERLLAEASRLFATQGYASTSVADIQLAAGMTAGSGALYKHFTSKEALLAEVVGLHIATVREGRRSFAETAPTELEPALRYLVAGVWAA